MPGARRAFLFKVALGEVGYGEMTPFSRSTWQPDRISLPDPAPWLCPRLRVVGVWTVRPHPVPFLPAFTLIYISVRHFRDWTANVAVAERPTFFFCSQCILHFSCHFSSFQEKAEFFRAEFKFAVADKRCVYTVSNCHCVQDRATRGRRVSDALSERLDRVERGCALIRYRSHIYTSVQKALSRRKIPHPGPGFLQDALK